MTAVTYFERIESARVPQDLFTDPEAARSQYRRLARIVHPDANPGDQERASDAFARLSILWDEYNGNGHNKPSGPLSYTTKRNTYVLSGLITRGDISNVYRVEYTPADDLLMSRTVATGVLKMSRNPRNNDLVANEIAMLKTLKEGVDEDYRMYHPKTVDSFRHRDVKTSKDRRAIVLPYLDGFVSLRDILDAYPTGIDPRDMAWMARRLWIAMDTAHAAGVVHGAVFPEHVMVHPTDHGLVLIDWSYAQEHGEKLEAAIPRYMKMGWYGTRYDKPLDHRLDIRQAAHTLEALLGLRGARPFRAFFNGCRVASTPPAGQLFQEFDELLHRLYGPRKYRPFAMPEGWRKEK